MGVEEWENKYKRQNKPQLSDFLDDEEENVILRMGRPNPEQPQTSVCQNSQGSRLLSATYPEGYDTIDRRRKKKIRDRGRLLSTESDKIGEEAFPSDLALLHEKKGELFMRQVAEMQEEEERMTSCLRPYKNGLLYKTRMWAKNELDSTLENYVAYKKEQDARMRAKFDFDLETSEDLEYSLRTEEDINDIAFITQDIHSDSTSHYRDRYTFSHDGHIENGQGLRDKKCGKAKIGGWATEAMLSPVEEPSDEYVDPMDELQCLVETVSEYLAEKEEEISKYGSLPKSSKSRLSSQGSNRTDSFGEDQKDAQREPRSPAPSDQNISGVKNAMSSLFSSITDRVGGGPKKPAPSPQAPSAQPSQSGLTKLLSFIPKSNSSAPVAVVSPVENSPEKSFSSLPSQPSHDAKTQGPTQETKTPLRSQAQSSTKEYLPEFVTKPQSTPKNTVLGKLSPLKLFSSGSNTNSSPESSHFQAHTQTEEKLAHQYMEVTTGSGPKSDKFKLSSQEKLLGHNQDTNTYCIQNQMINKQENTQVPEPARPAGQTQSTNTGFFSPLKKSLSSLIPPVVPIQPQTPPPIAVYPVFRSTDDPRLKVASSEDVSASVNTQNPVRSCQDSTSTASTTSTQNPPLPQGSTEKGWFSNIFNPTSAPSSSNQNFTSNKQSQNSNVPSQHISNQKPTTGQQGVQHQTPSQPESQGFLTGLFKGSSVDDTSQPKQGGILSGLLKFGSATDISGTLPQQTPQNSQPPRSSNLQHFPDHRPPQQHSSVPQPSEVGKHRNIPQNYPGQQQTTDQTQTQPQSKGLLSGLLKFASSDNISSSQTAQHQQSSVQQNQESFNQQNTQGLNRGPHLRSRASSQQMIHQETSKPGFTRQQTVPIKQPPSQQGGLLSGLFKFASADNINTQQHQTTQPHPITTSISSHEQTGARNNSSDGNQPQNSSMPKTSGILSGLFKSSENMTQQQQPGSVQDTQQHNKVPSRRTAEIQAEPVAQSGVLSGLLNKFTKSSENTDTCQTSYQRADNSTITMKTPQQTQMHMNVTQQSSQEHATKEKRVPRTAQQGFLSGLLSKNINDDCSTAKQVETSGQNTEQRTSSTKDSDLPLGILKSVPSDFGRDNCPRASASLNPGQSNHAFIGVPSTIAAESLDLRTSATFARSLQSQATFSSISTGNLSQLYYSGPPQSVYPMAYSTGNINSLLQNQTSSVMSMQPSVGGSNSSLYGTMHNQNQGQMSPYRISPSYDENQWISESIFWQQFQNESLNFQFQGGDQVYGQSNESASLQTSTLHHSFSNIYQPFNSSTPVQDGCHQEQIGPYQLEVHRNYDPCSKRKLWNSYEDLGNIQYSTNEDGALNLTTKQSNAKFGKWHSFSDGSTYSLNGVSYHEGYYEESAPSLSYSPNWQYGMDDSVLQNFHDDGMMQNQSLFNLNGPVDTNYPSRAKTEKEESLYLEDTEWYQQWLALLEQGMWWPAEDGDCGYFVYTDHEYIYALLTDAAGEFVYACAPEGESLGDAQTDGFPSAWLHNEMVCVCGFKIPLYNEDELLWLPAQDNCDSQLLNAPLDLSAAYKKGNQIMNLNLEQFSQMFENSFLSQGQQGVDFTSYTLNKVRMDPRHPSYGFEDQCKDVIDLSCRNKDHIGPYWNNHEMKTFLAQKVAVSLNSTPTYSDHQLLHSCYQPSQRRRSSTGVTVKHIDDVLEDEWRKRVSPGEEQPNRQVKKISSLISSFVGKASEMEMTKTSISSRDQAPDKISKNIISSGFQSLKSKIIKEEPSAAVTQPESVKQPQTQKPASTQRRILPTIPTTVHASQPSIESHTTSQKPRLSRQSTMVQHAGPPLQPKVTTPLGSKESLNKSETPGPLTPDKPHNIPAEKPPEQPQTGFMNFLKSAVGIEEPKPEPQKCPQTSPQQQSKTSSVGSLPGSSHSNKEAAGVSNIFGSIGSLFGAEPPSQQKGQMKPSVTEGSLTSSSRPKGIQRQQTLDQSGVARHPQSQPPNKSLSQGFSPNSSTQPAMSHSETMPPIEQTKHDTGPKPSGGLFGFSIGEMLSGSAAAAHSAPTPQTPAPATLPHEESIGKSILSLFSGPNPPQNSSNAGPKPQECPPHAAPPPPQQESIGKSLLSMFGGSGPQPSQAKPAAEVPLQGSVPLKEPPSSGFLSIFGGPSTQQSQDQSGSLLGGILPGSTNSTESSMKGLLSMFSDPSSSQPQPPTSTSQQGVAQSRSQQQGGPPSQSKPQEQPQAQGQPATSVLGGILGGLSTSTESPRKSLFSMFTGPSTTPTGTGGSANLSASLGTAAPKEPAKSIFSVFSDAVSPSQQTPNSSSAVVTSKEPPDTTSQLSSVSSSSVPVAEATCEKSSEVHEKPPTNTTVDATQGTTHKSSDIASMGPNTECATEHKEITNQGPTNNAAPSKEPPASSFLSMISGLGPQTPSPKAETLSDSPGKALLSLFSGPSTVNSSPTVSESGPSVPRDTPAKGLFSVFGGSAPQPSSQSGSSLLGAMFGGSSPQTTPSQTGGSLLGGLFGGSATQPSAQVGPTKIGGPQTAEPQTGPSLLGGLFGGSASQASTPQSGNSILGGLFGGSAGSTTGPQASGSFGGMFGGTTNQTSKSPNSNSILGGILGGGPSQTATEQTGTSLQGDIFHGASTPNKIPDKSQVSGSAPPSKAFPNKATSESNYDNKTLTTASTDSTSGDNHLLILSDNSKTAQALASPEMSIIDLAPQSQLHREIQQQADSTVQSVEESLPKIDADVTQEQTQSAERTAVAEDILSKESKICPQTQPPRPEHDVTGQLSQQTIPPKVEQETPATQSASAVVQGQNKAPEPDKPVADSAADTVTGFMSSLFKPTATSTDGSQQQQKSSLFGLGGTTPQTATGPAGASLLGGIFGGSNTETAAPQTGVSFLGGLFKGSAPQSGPSTTASTPGGSRLGGMFGGGPSAKFTGPQTGGSLLDGMFGGSVITQPGGSLLGGMFGGVTAPAEEPQTGPSVLSGIGGSLFGNIGKTPKSSEPIPTEPKPIPGTTSQPQITNENLPTKVSPVVDSTPPNNDQEQSSSQASSGVVPCEVVGPETASASLSATCDLAKKEDDTEIGKSTCDGETITEKPLVIKGDPELKESDKSAPPAMQEAQINVTVSNLSDNTEPPQAKSLFGFISTQSDAGKSLGSLFSPTGATSTPQTEGGSSLFSGLKTLSGSLFQEEKPVAGKQEPPTTSLFGTKISFPWQTEPPKPQTVPVITSQPKTDNKPTSGQTHTVQNLSTPDAKKTESVGSTDDTTNPQICISTPEVDPSASLTPKEKEKVVETSPSTGPTSGVQLDNQSKKELLNANRLVEA